MPDVRLEIFAETHGAPEKLRQTENALADLERRSGTMDKTAGGLWKQFAAGVVAAGLFQKAAHAVADGIQESIKAAIDAERVDKSLAAALEITGRSAAGLGDHFKEYAGELQKTTVYDDEAIKGAQALLVQLTNLDKDGIDRATRGAIGMASVFGTDLESAATLVAKAMAGNTAALSRYGIKVAEDLPLEEKRVQLLAQLEKMFGRATAETGTFGGQLAVLENRWGEVQEATGRWVTQQKGVVELMNKGTQSLLDYLTMGEMLDKATRSQEENQDRLADRLGKAAAAAGWQYGEMAKLVGQYYGREAQLIAAITQEKYGVEIKNAYIAALRTEKTAWEALEEARKKAERGTGGDASAELDKTTKAFITLTRAAQVAHSSMKPIDPLPFKLVGDVISNDVLYPLTRLPKPTRDWVEILKHVPGVVPGLERLGASFEKAREAVERYQAGAGAALSGIDAIAAQGTANRMIALDREYEHRRDIINQTIKDEDARQQALAKLDDEFAKKRKSAGAAAWLTGKAVAISNAIMSTHEAAAKAMAQGGFVLGIPWSAIISALGYVQVAAIAAQPIPLARGGVFTKRTRLTSERGTQYEVGEGGEAEILAPESKIKRAVAEAMRTARPAAPNITINMGGLHVHTPDLSEAGMHKVADKFLGIVQRKMQLDTSWQRA